MAFEEYLTNGMHIGMKQQTAKMKPFIYKTREDGLAVLDLQTIDSRLKTAAKFMARYDNIMVVSRKPIVFRAANRFAELVGAKAITGRFLPGIITNPSFRGYFEPEILIVSDPSVDSQAVKEAIDMRIPVIALCDTFNEISGVDFVIPLNNKGRKSVAMAFYVLARELLKAKGKIADDAEFKATLEEFESKELREPREYTERE